MKKPKLFKPSKKDAQRVLKTVAQHLSADKVVKSSDYPELQERGVN